MSQKDSFFSKRDQQNYHRLWQYLKPMWKILLIVLSATLVYGMLEPALPWVMSKIIDDGFSSNANGSNFKLIVLYVILMNLCFILRASANFASSYANTILTQRLTYNIRKEMFSKLIHLPMSFFHQNNAGQVLSKFTYDANQINAAASETLINVLRDVITILALLIYVLILDWKMTLTILLAVPIIAWLIVSISQKLRRLSNAMQLDMGHINHVIDEAIHARSVIHIHNAYEQEENRFEGKSREFMQHALFSGRIASIISPILEIIIVLALSCVILLAGSSAFGSSMTDGKFVGFLGAMALLFPPIKRLGRVNEPIQRGLAAMNSVFTFLDQASEAQRAKLGINISNGAVQFSNISFGYKDKMVLENFQLDIPAGQTIALVGESGAGKSTIAALLAGFYTPNAGTIYIDGFDTSQMSLEELRSSIAYVTQETILFSDSIAKNIAYPETNPDMEKVKQAAISANAYEFISDLENGFDTQINNKGNTLSGGQKQRLSIARALYKNAPILILDEATAALDNRSEKKVKEAIEMLRKNRTAIIIAHRLSTIEKADRIVVLRKGKIIESGSHQELLAQNGLYSKLLNNMNDD